MNLFPSKISLYSSLAQDRNQLNWFPCQLFVIWMYWTPFQDSIRLGVITSRCLQETSCHETHLIKENLFVLMALVLTNNHFHSTCFSSLGFEYMSKHLDWFYPFDQCCLYWHSLQYVAPDVISCKFSSYCKWKRIEDYYIFSIPPFSLGDLFWEFISPFSLFWSAIFCGNFALSGFSQELKLLNQMVTHPPISEGIWKVTVSWQ